MTLGLGITAGAIFGLLFLSAYFSGTETAMTATSRARIHELARRGDRKALILERLVSMPERLIGAILLGNNLVNILASALATSLFVKLFGDAGVVYATLVMTALVLVFGEVLPKTYSIINPDKVALAVSPAIKVLVAILAPIVMGVEFIVRHTLRLLGFDMSGTSSALTAHDELRGAIALHHQEGAVVKRDRDMLGGILDLRDLELSDVMVHRTKMHTIDAALAPADIITDVLASGFTRVPVWKDNTDNIIGILHAKDLLAALQANQGDASRITISKIIKTPWFVPDTTPVTDQLSAFLRRKAHFSIVVDEYGEVMGLVTLEDILEEIVGQIADEYDTEVSGVKKDPSGAYIIEGTTPVRDLNRQYDWDLPDDEATTIAGLVIHESQMIPETGQAFTFHGFRFEVVDRDRNQITSLKVVPLAAPRRRATSQQ